MDMFAKIKWFLVSQTFENNAFILTLISKEDVCLFLYDHKPIHKPTHGKTTGYMTPTCKIATPNSASLSHV